MTSPFFDEYDDTYHEEDDPLGPARGCVYGVALGALLWAPVIYVIWRVLT